MDVALLTVAMSVFGDRLARVDASQWGSPTPCTEWDVRSLVNHVAGELLWIPPLLEGRTIAEVGDRFDGDVLGADPLATWTSAVAAAEAAATEPGAQERTVHLSFGDFPGGGYLGQITSDLVIHGWDLARAVKADDRIAPDLLQFVAAFLGPQVEDWRSAGAFGASVEPDKEAGVQDQLIAQTGRLPGWAP